MKIVYWSPIHGQAGTTSNIIITALITGMEHRRTGLLTQTHFNFNNLEAPFVGSNAKNVTSKEFFRDVGIDLLIRNFKAEKLDKERIDNCCISLPQTNLSLLPGTSKHNRDSYEYEVDTVILNLLRTVEGFTNIIFLDVSSGNNETSMKIIADANLTVVNLSQNISIIDSYFEEYHKLLNSKVFFLFGNYDCNSKYNINNIRRRYKEITKNNSGVIPYNTAYLDAQCDGKVLDFVRSNIHTRKDDEHGYFMMKAKKATEKILKQAGVSIT